MIDRDADLALWRSICDAAEKLIDKSGVFILDRKHSQRRIKLGALLPNVDTWQLVEALSLVTILLKADRISPKAQIVLFGPTGPIHSIEDGQDRYLWTQASIKGSDSDLVGRPDIVITKSSDAPSSTNILHIVECKCKKHLGTPDIRAEFGKAFDLKVRAYLIWSFFSPPQRIIDGAKGLGIDISPLGFDTSLRESLISQSERLQEHVYSTIEASRREELFANTITKGSLTIQRKLESLAKA